MAAKLLITLLIISITISHLGCSANQNPECISIKSPSNPKQLKLDARDAITMTIFAVRDMLKFAHRVTHLKSLSNRLTPKLLNCLEDFIERSKGIEDLLRKLRHLKPPGLASCRAQSLDTMTRNALELGAKCSKAILEFDPILRAVLGNKLDSVKQLNVDVQYRIYELEDGCNNSPNCA